MRPIKFRGRDLEGKMRSGYYAEDKGYPYIVESHCWHEIYPDTVAQLVGTDKNGREIYEGDVLQYDYNGVHYEYKARLDSCAVADNGCYLLAKQLSAHELKEVST